MVYSVRDAMLYAGNEFVIRNKIKHVTMRTTFILKNVFK